MNLSYKHIAPFLVTGQNKFSRWISYFGLGIGILLLLCAVQMYNNVSHLLKEKNVRKDGYDYIAVTRLITNENMAEDHSFSDADIAAIKAQKNIDNVVPLFANKFQVRASGGSLLPFTTDIFLEAIDSSFIDTVPPEFTWKEGQEVVPLIISADYLELYNTVFAPGQGLPQFSAKSVASVMINLECTGPSGRSEMFRARVVGLSDRINSVLAPVNFLAWANKHLTGSFANHPSRIFIKTKDANDPELLNFLQQKNYHVNKDKTRFGRVKQVLQVIVGSLGAFGMLMVLLSLVLFSFYLQLMISKSKDALQLLLTLGYSPAWLGKTVAKKWIPVYIFVIGGSIDDHCYLTMELSAFCNEGKRGTVYVCSLDSRGNSPSIVGSCGNDQLQADTKINVETKLIKLH